MSENAVARLLAKQEIYERMLSYARAVDRRDWDAIPATFHPDADIVHGAHSGGPAGLVTILQGRQRGITVSIHLLTNCLVEFVTERHALAETYLLAHQWMTAEGAREWNLESGPEGLEVQSWGRYLDEFTLREGAWRVQRRRTLFESFSRQPALHRLPHPPGWLEARSDAEDLLLQTRRRLGLVSPSPL